ncbi:MAG: hypothetical protein IJX76_04465 [Clostridia bacterium]|nr:hypothetical protein [Clostridia bacterium]
MKKIITLTLALLMLVGCFTGCSVIEGLFGPSSKTFSTEGFSITMTDEFYEKEHISYTYCLESPDALLAVVKEKFDAYADFGISLEDMTITEYADLVIEANMITDNTPVTEEDGLTYFTYESEEDGKNFYYVCYLIKGSDAFWIVNLACLADAKDDYTPKFEEWAKSIKVD